MSVIVSFVGGACPGVVALRMLCGGTRPPQAGLLAAASTMIIEADHQYQHHHHYHHHYARGLLGLGVHPF